MTYYVYLPDGRSLPFDDSVPKGVAQWQALQAMQPKETEASPVQGTGSNYFPISHGIDLAQQGLFSALSGAGRTFGVDYFRDIGEAGVLRNIEEAKVSAPSGGNVGWDQVRGDDPSTWAKYAGQTIAQTVPQTAAILGASALGAPGGLPGMIAAGTAAALPFTYGQHRERQIQEAQQKAGDQSRDVDVSEGAAFGYAIPSALMETVADRLTFGLSRLGFGKKAAEELGATLLPRIAKGIGVGVTAEVPTEVIQQVLERAQAGLDLGSDDALKEYKEAAIGAAVVGGTFGGAAHGAMGPRPRAPGTRGEDEELKTALEAEYAGNAPLGAIPVPGFVPPVVTPLGELTPKIADTFFGKRYEGLDQIEDMDTRLKAGAHLFSQEVGGVSGAIAASQATVDGHKAIIQSTQEKIKEVIAVAKKAKQPKPVDAIKQLQTQISENAALLKEESANIRKLRATLPTLPKEATEGSKFFNNPAQQIADAIAAVTAAPTEDTVVAPVTPTPEVTPATDLATPPIVPEVAPTAIPEATPAAPSSFFWNTMGYKFPVNIIQAGPVVGGRNTVVIQGVTGGESTQVFADEITGQPGEPTGELQEGTYDPAQEPGARVFKLPENQDLAPEPGVTFKTALGSIYSAHANNTTTRNKSYHPEHGQENQGPQPRSEQTFYISPEDANKLGEIQTKGVTDVRSIQLTGQNDSEIGIKYLTGKNNGKFEKRTIITASNTPAIGLIPVELWNDGTRVHFGNKITEILPTTSVAPVLTLTPEAFTGPAPSDVGAVAGETRRSQSVGKEGLGLYSSRTMEPGPAPGIPGPISPDITPATTATEATPQAVSKTREVINDRLNKLGEMGRLGRTLKAGLNNILKNSTITPPQLYAAFRSADIIATMLPANVNHRIEFVEHILREGSFREGFRINPTETSMGLIQISLSNNVLDIIHETTAHEAYHALQDYFAKYDPKLAEFLNKDFKDGMTLNDVEASIQRKLKTTVAPNGESYWNNLQKSDVNGLGTKELSAREMQAYVFGALSDASRRGVPMSGIRPTYARLVTNIKDFFNKLRNVLRGDGFTTFEQVFSAPAEGVSARQFADVQSPIGPVATEQFSSRTSEPYNVQGNVEYAGRTLRAAPAGSSFAEKTTLINQPKYGILERGLAKLSGAKSRTGIYGGVQAEKAIDSLTRTSVNRAHPMYVTQHMLKTKGKIITRDAARMIEMAYNHGGRIKTLLDVGGLQMDPVTGLVSLDRSVKPLLPIFANKVSAGNNTQEALAQAYFIARREQDMRKNNRQGFLNVSDAEVVQTIRESEAKQPKWIEVADDLDKFNNMLTKFAKDSGLITKEQEKYFSSMFYTPLYREMEKDSIGSPGQAIGPSTSQALNNPRAFVHKMKGGTGAVSELFENIVMNADSIIKAGLKNVAMQASSEVMEMAGIANRVSSKHVPHSRENIITFHKDGKAVHYEIDDPVLWMSIAGAPQVMRSGILKVMAQIGHVFRDAITSTPSYMWANVWRGKVIAKGQEALPFTSNTIKSFAQAYKGGGVADEIAASTGFGGFTIGQGERNAARALRRELRLASGEANMYDRVTRAVKGLQRISESAEMAERINIHDMVLKEGGIKQDALWRAYLFAPFGRSGTGDGAIGASLQTMLPLVPFLNAKIQGLYRIYEGKGIGEKRVLGAMPKDIFLRSLWITAFSTLASMFSSLAEPEKWANEPVHDKMNYDIVYLFGETIKVPRGFELGIFFGALPTFLMDAITLENGNRNLGIALGQAISTTFGFAAIPAAVSPVLEFMTNRDFFRNQPLESYGQQRLPVGERINLKTSGTAANISDIARGIGEPLKNVPIVGALANVSPIHAQALIEGYTGTLGTTFMTLIDKLYTNMSSNASYASQQTSAFGVPGGVADLAATILGVSRFLKTDLEKSSVLVGEFYDLRKSVNEISASIKAAQDVGDQERLGRISPREEIALSMNKFMNRAATDMAKISAQIKVINADQGMAYSAKEELKRELLAMRNQIAQEAGRAAREAGL